MAGAKASGVDAGEGFQVHMHLPGRAKYILFALLLAALTALYYRPFFQLDKGIIREPLNPKEFATDLTPQFGVYAEVWKQSLVSHKALPHWFPYIMGGQPFLSEPGVPFISLEQLLLVPFPGQTAARLSIPLHIAAGWIGLYAFLLAIGLRERETLLAGAIYLLNPSYMAFNAFSGHLNIVHGVALVPWLLYVAVRPFRWRWSRAIWLAVLLSAMVHAGATEIFVVTCVFGFPCYLLHEGWNCREWRRAVFDLTAVILLVTGLSAVKILPAMDFLAVSQRQFGMDAARAFGGRYEDAFDATGYTLKCGMSNTPVTVATYWVLVPLFGFVLVGAARLWNAQRSVLIFCLAIAAIPVLVTYHYGLFKLIRGLPVFAGQRSPSKSLYLTFLVIGLLASAGVHRIAKTRAGRRAILAPVLTWAATVAVLGSVFMRHPPLPTMDDLNARRMNNPVLAYVKKDPSFFRLTSYQDVDVNWTWEHQTVPDGIRLLMGYARLWHNDMLFSDFTASVSRPQFPFVPLVYRNYATMIGLLSVKYVASTEPLDLAGLDLAAEFRITEPAPQPLKSAGPFLYRNTRALPRAYSGTRTVLIAANYDAVRNVGLRLLCNDPWPSDRFTLLYLTPGSEDAAAAAMEHADYILAGGDTRVPPLFAHKLIDLISLKTMTDQKAVAPGSGDGTDVQETSPAVQRLTECDVHEINPEHLQVAITPSLRGRWLVLSETFALFHGWSATVPVDRAVRHLPLVRCNHVNTAIWIPADAHGDLVLTYVTPGFRAGLLLLALSGALIGAYGVRKAWSERHGKKLRRELHGLWGMTSGPLPNEGNSIPSRGRELT